MKIFVLFIAMFAALLSAATYLAPLKVFNALAPIDSGTTTRAVDVSYGPDPRHRLDVYTPDSKPIAAPIVIIVYGGSWNSGSKSDYAFLGRSLAARGFVAMVIDYRLVPDVRFPAFVDDCARAVAWAHKNGDRFGGDASNLFVIGHSAGAYNAVMIALAPRFLERHGATPARLRGVAGLAGPYDFLPLDSASTIAAFGGADDLAKTQPINFVSTRSPALFLATGANDDTVYPRHSKDLARRLQRIGNRATLKVYPDLGHVGVLLALSRPFRNFAPVLNDVSEFFRSEMTAPKPATRPAS